MANLTVILNRAVAAYNKGQLNEAEQLCQRVIAIKRNFFDALHLVAVVQSRLGKKDEALASYDRALKVRPDYAEALFNRGNTLHELKRFEEALASFDRALKVRPDYADALYNRGLLRLLVGQYKDGWADHEWRWEAKVFPGKRPKIDVPIWQGEDLSGRHLLVISEQGLGDTIQFARYLPLLVERKCKVTFLAPVLLKRLLKLSFQAIEIVSELEGIHGIDFQVALTSLPHRFNTEPLSIPNKVPYLEIEPHLKMRWKDRIGTQSFKIGIVWSGNPMHKNDHNRSMNLSLFLPLLDAQATFVSLQTDIGPNDAALLKEQENILNFGEELKDFSDSAAIISNLDLVISVDTSVAHLAGALGKPIWVLLPFIPDWRWLLDREDSLWYPTARLFRQNDTRVWDTVIARVHTALHDFVQIRP